MKPFPKRKGEGRYAGVSMSPSSGKDGAILPGAASFLEGARLPAEPSEIAKRRVKVIQWYQERGEKVRFTARHFGFSPDTISRRGRAYQERGVAGLEPRRRRPRRLRQ